MEFEIMISRPFILPKCFTFCRTFINFSHCHFYIGEMGSFKNMFCIIQWNKKHRQKPLIVVRRSLSSLLGSVSWLLFKIAVLRHDDRQRENNLRNLDYTAPLNHAFDTFNVAKNVSLRDARQLPSFDLNVNHWKFFP